MNQAKSIFKLVSLENSPPRFFKTEAETKLLYRACRAILTETGMKWDALYIAAFGKAFHRGTDYEANFRAGRIDRQKARAIFRWMIAAHPVQAHRVYNGVLKLRLSVLRRIRDPGSPRQKKLDADLRKTVKTMEQNLTNRDALVEKAKNDGSSGKS